MGKRLGIVVDDEPAEEGAILAYFFLTLQEDDLKGVLVDGVLAHRDEHAQWPGELLPVSQIKRTVFFQLFIEGVEDGL